MWAYGLSRFVISVSAVVTVGYFLYGQAWIRAAEGNYREIANPLVELLSTALARDANSLSTSPTSFSSDVDFQAGTVTSSSGRYNASGQVKNVILVVMESVGAEYVIDSMPLNKPEMPIEVTPELTKARKNGRVEALCRHSSEAMGGRRGGTNSGRSNSR